MSEICDKNDIDFIITPHDNYIFKYLKDIKISALKIGSGEVGNLGFLGWLIEVTTFFSRSRGVGLLHQSMEAVLSRSERPIYGD